MGFKNITPVIVQVVDGSGSLVNLNMEQVAGSNYPMHSLYRGGQTQEPVRQHLDTVGNGTGTMEAAADHSITEGIFRLKPDPGVVYRVHELVIFMRDGSTGAAWASNVFAAATALTNGLGLTQETSAGTSVVKQLLGGVLVKDNATLQAVGALVQPQAWGLDRTLTATFNFQKMMGEPLRLEGTPADELIVRLNDNLTALSSLQFFASGYVE